MSAEGARTGSTEDVDIRDAALRWAERARRRRQELVDGLSEGRLSLEDVLADADDDPLVGHVAVLCLLEAVPGARKVDTRRRLARTGIDAATPIGELSAAERGAVAALRSVADPTVAPHGRTGGAR